MFKARRNSISNKNKRYFLPELMSGEIEFSGGKIERI